MRNVLVSIVLSLLTGCAAIPVSFGVVGAACVGDMAGVLNTGLCTPSMEKEK